MAKETKDLTKPASGVPGLHRPDLPEHLQGDFGTEEASEFITPPRIKVVQALSSRLHELGFDTGDCVVVPQNLMLAPIEQIEKGGKTRPGEAGFPFHFVPLLFFVEYCLWNPLETRESLPMIRERSYDKDSEIAKRARDPKLRTMLCPEFPEKDGKQLHCRYVEHLNFIVLLQDEHELAGVPLLLSFSKGEHNQGRQLLALMKLRKVPICGARYVGQVRHRTPSGKDWFGIDINNPLDKEPFVTDPDEFAVYKGFHEDLKNAHESNKLRADYSDEEAEDADANANAAASTDF